MQRKDLTGQVFGELTVQYLSERKTNQGKAIWVCDCSCGRKNVEVYAQSL